MGNEKEKAEAEEKPKQELEKIAISSDEIHARLLHKNASAIANSSMIPSSYRGDIGAVFGVMLMGEEKGLGAMTALQYFQPIEGKMGSSPEYMRAQVLKAGHIIQFKEKTNEKCVIYGKRSDNGQEQEVEWTIQDAQTAGLAQKNNWKKYPRAMLAARASSELCRDLFPDVIGGISYTPEELDGDEIFIEERPKKAEPKPEVKEKAEEAEIQEAEIVEDEKPIELASDADIEKLIQLRKDLELSPAQSKKVKAFVEESGWSFGQFNADSGRYIDSHIPKEAIKEIERKIRDIAGLASKEQLGKIFATLKGLPKDLQSQASDAYKLMYKDKSRKDLSKKEASEWIAYLESLKEGEQDASEEPSEDIE